MSNIRNLIEAAQKTMDGTALVASISALIKAELPNSYSRVQLQEGHETTIQVAFGLIGERSGSFHSDPLPVLLHIFGLEKAGSIIKPLNIMDASGTALAINAPEGSHLAFTSIKTGWRKKTGTPQQIIKHLKTYFARLHKVVRDNEANVYQRSQYNDKYFK